MSNLIKLEGINRWLTLLANLGVVAGIVFLAVEVRQNQATLERGHAMNLVVVQDAVQNRYSEFRRLTLESDELYLIWRKGLDDDALTELERWKFEDLCREFAYSRATAHRLYSALGRAMEAKNAIDNVRSLIARSKTFKACWTDEVRPPAERTGYFDFIAGVDAA